MWKGLYRLHFTGERISVSIWLAYISQGDRTVAVRCIIDVYHLKKHAELKECWPSCHEVVNHWLLRNDFSSPVWKGFLHFGFDPFPVLITSARSSTLSLSRLVSDFPMGCGGQKLTSDRRGFFMANAGLAFPFGIQARMLRYKGLRHSVEFLATAVNFIFDNFLQQGHCHSVCM